MAEKASVKIPFRDQLWLQMDTPDNLMYINSLMWFEEIPDWDAITTVIAEKIVDPYPVFRRVSERRGRRWYWVDFPEFDFDAHFSRSTLPGDGGRDEAEKLIDLAGVKRVAKAHDSTVTIVITAAVSRALTEYLRTQGDKPLADINLMIPMSVAPVGEGAPAELGNHITLILLRLPLWVDDSQQLINEITSSMTRVQYSFEPHATYAAIVGSAAVPSGLTNSLVDVVANKSIGQLTSVPGPSGPVTFGGVPVGGLLGWVPMTGDQSLGVCIYSYNGQVSVGIATDAGLVPEPGILARMIGEQFETFAGWNE